MEQQFQDFIMSVPSEEQEMVLELDGMFRKSGYECDISPAKNGFLVSYVKKLKQQKTTIANFIFRKSGVKIRLYASNIQQYDEFLDTLPKTMKAEIMKSGDCKRLFDPSACNPRCKMGYIFHMDGMEYRKCRNMAFVPTLSKENDPYIRTWVIAELKELEKVGLK